jgi:hypothetical protein
VVSEMHKMIIYFIEQLWNIIFKNIS